MKKALIISDSMAMPRVELKYEDTWVFKLQQNIKSIHFINRTSRGANSNRLIEEGGDSLEFYNPDIVILQLGIVDCAPRYLKQTSFHYRFINHLPKIIQFLFWKTLKKIKKRDVKNADVPVDKFKSNLTSYFNRCILHNVKKIIVIKIPTPARQMIERNAGICEAVKTYNLIYDEFALNNSLIEVVNPLSHGDEAVYIDGYHPNKLGNDLIYNSLNKELKCLK